MEAYVDAISPETAAEPYARWGEWRVRIHDAEGPEEPHVTIYKKGRKWRLSLRTEEFLDAGDKWSQIDSGVRSAIRKKWRTLRKEWNKLHGHFNPISSEDAE